MKDQLLLLLTGLICAAGSWLFFRYLGSDAFSVLALIALFTLVVDNARLRRRLREMDAKP